MSGDAGIEVGAYGHIRFQFALKGSHLQHMLAVQNDAVLVGGEAFDVGAVCQL